MMSQDTRSSAKLLTDAYVEVLVGLFVLRIPRGSECNMFFRTGDDCDVLVRRRAH